jgi:hypothetical protein
MTLAAHPFAELFPLIEGEEFLAFAEDIRANGVRDPIVLLGGAILDGRNRANALAHLAETGEILGEGWGHRAGEPLSPDCLEDDYPWIRKFSRDIDGDPLAWVLSKNLKRRHLSDRQRESIAGEIANLGRGRPSNEKEFEPAPDHIPPIGGISAQAAAAMLNVAPRGVERARVVHSEGAPEVRAAFRRGELATSVAESIARLPEAEQPAALEKVLPNGARAIMGSRKEPDDSLDYFPTPPWATRALVEHVLLPQLMENNIANYSAWEPACGEGHIAEVLKEYFGKVAATDIHDYGYGDVRDFLVDSDLPRRADWIITNPPFGDNSEKFVLRALDLARVGVAMFVRLQWLETNGRYERIFRNHPPTLIAFFAERVPLCKGRWNPEGDTATAYIWLTWVKGRAPRAPFWIPPDCRKALTKSDDVERFTQRPVKKHDSEIPREEASGTAREAPSTGSGLADDGQSNGTQSAPPHLSDQALDLPIFLKRDANNAAPFANGSAA